MPKSRPPNPRVAVCPHSGLGLLLLSWILVSTGKGFDAGLPQVGAGSLSRFPWAPGRLSYLPGSILGSVFLWWCFCRQEPPCSGNFLAIRPSVLVCFIVGVGHLRFSKALHVFVGSVLCRVPVKGSCTEGSRKIKALIGRCGSRNGLLLVGNPSGKVRRSPPFPNEFPGGRNPF